MNYSWYDHPTRYVLAIYYLKLTYPKLLCLSNPSTHDGKIHTFKGLLIKIIPVNFMDIYR